MRVSEEVRAAGPTARWRIAPPPHLLPDVAAPRIVRALLAVRRISDPAAWLWDDAPPAGPLDLPGIDRAADRLRHARHRGETVAIYGDYDVDGVTATAQLVEGLRAFGLRTLPYIPNRYTEGYGLNADAIRTLHDAGAHLLLTVDCGVSAHAEVALARRLGMDVMVLDHHIEPSTPGGRVPATAIINPRDAPPGHPSAHLASAGLAFRLLQHLAQELDEPLDEPGLLQLAALGTLADVVPLLGDNRRIVRAGLRALAATARPGLRALCAVARVVPSQYDAALDEEAVLFQLAPRLNAAGRLTHARTALDLLLADQPGRAAALADELDVLNRQRQRETEQALAEAIAQVEGTPGEAVLVAGSAAMRAGIVGLVAARLTELYGRPAFAYAVEGERARGSARGVPGFDVTRALADVSHLLERFGGHAQAAGFTVAVARLDAFRSALAEAASRQLPDGAGRAPLEVDLAFRLRYLGREVAGWLARLGPFGPGNPPPTFLSRDITVSAARRVGAGAEHLALELEDAGARWRAIAFRAARRPWLPTAGERIDVVYRPRPERNGYQPDLLLLDFAPSAS